MKCNPKYLAQCGGSAPAVVSVQTTDGIKGLANAFVYVLSNNTTYYVSPCHEIITIMSGDVYVDNYNFATNPLNLANQTVYDFANNVAATYNAKGEYRLIDLKEAA